MSSEKIFESFRISNKEFNKLQEKFGNLCRFQMWALLRRNVRNNHTYDQEDIEQELLMAVMRAAVYYKRQTYIESCLKVALRYAKDDMVRRVVLELEDLWYNKKKGVKFGELQEQLLERIVETIVPARKRPKKDRELVMDDTFATYCKKITWNQQKSMGKKITREHPLRNGLVSLSEFDHVSYLTTG